MRWWWVGEDEHAVGVCEALRALADWPAPERLRSAEHALAETATAAPALVVTQLLLPCASGIHLAHALRRLTPRPRVLVIGEPEHALFAIRARKSGARGYQRLAVGPRALAEAALAVAGGRVAIDRDTVAAITASSFDPLTQRLARLTPREFEVLLMTWRGHKPDRVADCLGLRVATVRRHLESACRRAGVASIKELTGLGALLGL